MKVPLAIHIISYFYDVIKSEGNLAKGQIEKFNMASNQPIPPIGRRVSELRQDENNVDYETLWVHLGNNWFKCIGWWQ